MFPSLISLASDSPAALPNNPRGCCCGENNIRELRQGTDLRYCQGPAAHWSRPRGKESFGPARETTQVREKGELSRLRNAQTTGERCSSSRETCPGPLRLFNPMVIDPGFSVASGSCAQAPHPAAPPPLSRRPSSYRRPPTLRAPALGLHPGSYNQLPPAPTTLPSAST